MVDPLARQTHRPWAIPATPWAWRQTWHDLLFMHWPVSPSVIRPYVPEPLALDTREGQAWLGLVPFRMSGVTLRGVPPLPWLSAFAEMNLRTYVTIDAKPGVFFLRMDAARALAVWAARLSLQLPYVWSRMRVSRGAQGDVQYESQHGSAVFKASYGPTTPPREPTPESIEAFLTERYCLYTVIRRRLRRVEIHHWPWPLQNAAVAVAANTIPQSLGLPPPQGQVLNHFADRLDVVGWAAARV
jgi:uncharacterized protein